MSFLKKAAPLIYPGPAGTLRGDIALLLGRIFFGGLMLAGHGWMKLSGFSAIAERGFPDPLGIGSTASLAMATGAEFFAALAVVLGFLTRLSLLPLIATMLVATFLVNMGKVPSLGDIPADADTLNALISPIELSLLYLVGYIILLLTGPGRFSLDGALLHKR